MRYLKPGPASVRATQTAVIVPIPAADPFVSEYRDRLDQAAGWGVPAHVTILYPFRAPADIDECTLAALETAASSIRAFDCSFPVTAWFGNEVLWLAPEPPEPFRLLTEAVCATFPECLPYGGKYTGVTPHLTVAETRIADLDAVQSVEQAVRRALPITMRIERAVLIAGAEMADSWRVLHELPLAR